MRKRRNPDTCIDNKILDFLIYSVTRLLPLVGLLVSSHCLFFPTWPAYPTYFVPPKYLTWHTILFVSSGFIVGTQSCWFIVQIVFLLITTNIWYTWLVILECICSSDRPSITRKLKFQRASPLFKEYRNLQQYLVQLQILHVNFMYVFSILFLPIYMIGSNIALFCNYTLIKHINTIDATNAGVLVIWSLTAFIGVVGFFGLLGEIRSFCGMMLFSISSYNWGYKRKRKEMKRFIRSFQPISYGYGRMYIIKRVSVLKFVKAVSRGTFRALLTV